MYYKQVYSRPHFHFEKFKLIRGILLSLFYNLAIPLVFKLASNKLKVPQYFKLLLEDIGEI